MCLEKKNEKNPVCETILWSLADRIKNLILKNNLVYQTAIWSLEGLTYLLSHTEITAQHYLWLYRRTIVKGIRIVSPLFICILKASTLLLMYFLSIIAVHITLVIIYSQRPQLNSNQDYVVYKPAIGQVHGDITI